MEKLKKQRKKLERKLERRQNIRQKLRRFIRYAKKRGLKDLAGQAEKVEARLEDRCKELHGEIADLNEQIEALQAQRENDRKEFVQWLLSKVGVQEYSAEHKKWAADLGYSTNLPWCSIFVAWKLRDLGFSMPPNPAYTGNWLNWSGGTRVSYSQVQPGDLLIFDWGDGGITDHVAVYVGDGKKVGGNENNRVEHDPVPTANVVGVVRPKWD